MRKVQTTKDLEKRWSVSADALPQHSAETTLLLDDSTLKAHLQPYNHVCVMEYTQTLRDRDIRAKYIVERREACVDGAAQVQLVFPGLAPESFQSAKRKRKRKRKGNASEARFDSVLVAVIGVLDEAKDQTNVAGWMRAGGLWAGHEPPSSANGMSDTSMRACHLLFVD